MAFAKLMTAASAALITGAGQSAPPRAVAQTTAAPQSASYFQSDAELTQLLRGLVERGESKGLVLGLLEPDGRRRVITFGSAGAGATTLSSKTVFETGSIAKTFTSAILADMVRRGEVSLNDPVSKYLPAGVKVPSRNGRQISLLDLATHTSGLPRSLNIERIRDFSNPYAALPIGEVYDFLASHELRREIGSEWEYSNLSYGLLGHALARAGGAGSIEELIRQRITVPLNLANTGYVRADGAAMAKGHNPKGEPVAYWDFGEFKGAGGLNSTAEDMLTFLQANVGEPQSAIGTAIHDTHQPRNAMKLKGNSQALGWDHRVRGTRTIVYKSGSTAGFAGAIGFDPATGAGVVILGNSSGFKSRVDVLLQLLKGDRP